MTDTRIDITELRAKLEGATGPAYWRGLDQLAETEEFREFLHKEFPRQAAPLDYGLDRRDFMKLLGASMALAGLSACARPPLAREEVVPYVRQPAEITPGKPLFFATAVTYGGFAEGVLAESHQGRPTKLEGNPDHPASLGSTAAQTQAQVLALYDPDRSREVLAAGQPREWEDFTDALDSALGALGEGGNGLAILTENVTSPTLASQLNEVLRARPAARWYQYDALHPDNVVAGARAAFGTEALPVYDLSNADVIVSLDADFLDFGPGRLANARAFGAKRRVLTADDSMNRLYQLETTPSVTGSLADHRVALKPSDVALAAAAIATELGVNAPAAQRPAALAAGVFDALVADLDANRGSSVVIAGHTQPPAVHALAHALNEALGNVGSTVRYIANPSARPAIHAEEISELVGAIRDGSVTTLLVLGGNPVYTAPRDLGFGAAVQGLAFSAHLGLHFDETASVCQWHVPKAHFLEAWSDARAFDGTTTILQPLILPFYSGKSEHEMLAAVLGDASASGYDIVRSSWRARVTGSFDDFWRESVYRGAVAGSASPVLEVTAAANDLQLPAGAALELGLVFDSAIADGRFANNGWLLELPRPITKLSWDNAALVAPATAEALGVATGDMLTLSANGRSVAAAVWVQPGQAIGAISIALGFGRAAAGTVGNGVGFDAYPLMAAGNAFSAALTATRAGGSYKLVTTQTHQNLEGTGEARHIVRAGTLATLRSDPDHPHFAHPVPHHEADLMADFEYRGSRWGMVIDQTVCTGCNACVVACQSENNIPIVGKTEVSKGREMHWIRVDSYFNGGLDDPTFFSQPMPCQQCEKAPCEPVCPVGATVHDSEGLNVMVYNRCVGTRYCSNNCPYKVRRYNWLQYAELDTSATELSLANNPDVTVRSRGVMEKCTYCTQRISRARIEASNERRDIRDGEVVTACQAACPTQAIYFGDLNDPDAAVNVAKASPINYHMLEELQTFPRTTYLAKITNPNPSLADRSS